jgi:orotidine-5'-phosphate decarboxylase
MAAPERSEMTPPEPIQTRERLIETPRSIIPACDVNTLEHYERIIQETGDIEGIGGYKVGFELGLTYGLPEVVARGKKYTSKPIIYDHQKAGSDIPDTAMNFARTMQAAGVDSAIIFPQAGPETQKAWIQSLQDKGINVMVGLHMTHQKFLESEGGYISDSAPFRAFELAANMGVRDFVVPGNKVESVAKYREFLESILGEGGFDLYAPGFVKQGGRIEDAAKAAGNNWHAIVGSGIYSKDDMRSAANELVTSLNL